ncbi:IS607 family transposase [Thermogladius sp. KZ2Tp1]|uniref:IS607 family transposase n=1 Tax=Thermogladius sp. KZ2Tp1 TaxID=3136289 RepID=UPI003DA85A73
MDRKVYKLWFCLCLLVLFISERLLRPKEVCQRLGISYSTLSRWVREGRIKAIRTAGGKYRIPESEVRRIIEGIPAGEVRAVVYARVSSSDQKSDLERQVQYLTQYCSAKGYRVVDVLTDVASGLKADRRGLLKLFEYVVNKKVGVVVVAYRDRLTRFGFEYLEYFFRQYGVRIEVVLGEEPKDAHRELVEDLIEIVTSFAGKLYGLRSHKKKRFLEEFKELLEEVEKDEGN